MATAAAQGSDFVVLTSDNPRSEDPLAIINDAVVGLQRSGTRYKTEPDRRAARSIRKWCGIGLWRLLSGLHAPPLRSA